MVNRFMGYRFTVFRFTVDRFTVYIFTVYRFTVYRFGSSAFPHLWLEYLQYKEIASLTEVLVARCSKCNLLEFHETDVEET